MVCHDNEQYKYIYRINNADQLHKNSLKMFIAVKTFCNMNFGSDQFSLGKCSPTAVHTTFCHALLYTIFTIFQNENIENSYKHAIMYIFQKLNIFTNCLAEFNYK